MRFSSPYDVVVRTTISTCLTRSAVEDSAVSERKNTESGNVTVRIQNPNGLREGKELIQSRSYIRYCKDILIVIHNSMRVTYMCTDWKGPGLSLIHI